ncbi:thioesterase family protein [Streptomyces sp. SCA3-4]|uniref:thioesterase family protein n=1 Tax=Streptomyces sichuanensis TaxID=2871810 RepID=UPI001CE2C70F|nr:thioesterase family protein [Streptomyces sichuanensis]MCA6094681.1 thioesterase family protein [Streptomyces sichuanensis]
MTTVTESAVKTLLTSETTASLRTRYEGSNICTWIGFKHINYLVEEAILYHFAAAGLPARALYAEHGLGVDLVDLDTRILTALYMDETVVAKVVPSAGDDDFISFTVALHAERDGDPDTKAITAKAKVVLRSDSYVEEAGEPPAALARFVSHRLSTPVTHLPELPDLSGVDLSADNTALSSGRGTTGPDPVLDLLTAGTNSFGWKWRIPYPYCHFSERLQMSSYLRQMEEVVDLFLADRGISVKSLLDERRWIPACPHSRIQIIDEALMEEELYTIYTVENIFKDFTYTSRMDCYVVRDGKLVQTATGKVTHGYAKIDNRRDWNLVTFDERVSKALRGEA